MKTMGFWRPTPSLEKLITKFFKSRWLPAMTKNLMLYRFDFHFLIPLFHCCSIRFFYRVSQIEMRTARKLFLSINGARKVHTTRVNSRSLTSYGVPKKTDVHGAFGDLQNPIYWSPGQVGSLKPYCIPIVLQKTEICWVHSPRVLSYGSLKTALVRY